MLARRAWTAISILASLPLALFAPGKLQITLSLEDGGFFCCRSSFCGTMPIKPLHTDQILVETSNIVASFHHSKMSDFQGLTSKCVFIPYLPQKNFQHHLLVLLLFFVFRIVLSLALASLSSYWVKDPIFSTWLPPLTIGCNGIQQHWITHRVRFQTPKV